MRVLHIRDDGRQHTIDVFEDIVVPETHHSAALRFKPRRSTLVRLDLERMLATVNFGDKSMFAATEIDNVSRKLPAKFHSEKLSIA